MRNKIDPQELEEKLKEAPFGVVRDAAQAYADILPHLEELTFFINWVLYSVGNERREDLEMAIRGIAQKLKGEEPTQQ